jgi:hypothetical protein
MMIRKCQALAPLLAGLCAFGIGCESKEKTVVEKWEESPLPVTNSVDQVGFFEMADQVFEVLFNTQKSLYLTREGDVPQKSPKEVEEGYRLTGFDGIFLQIPSAQTDDYAGNEIPKIEVGKACGIARTKSPGIHMSLPAIIYQQLRMVKSLNEDSLYGYRISKSETPEGSDRLFNLQLEADENSIDRKVVMSGSANDTEFLIKASYIETARPDASRDSVSQIDLDVYANIATKEVKVSWNGHLLGEIDGERINRSLGVQVLWTLDATDTGRITENYQFTGDRNGVVSNHNGHLTMAKKDADTSEWESIENLGSGEVVRSRLQLVNKAPVKALAEDEGEALPKVCTVDGYYVSK